MTGPLKDQKVIIDKPHKPFGEHVDIITPLPGLPGVHKERIGPDGKVITEDVIIKKDKFNIIDNTK